MALVYQGVQALAFGPNHIPKCSKREYRIAGGDDFVPVLNIDVSATVSAAHFVFSSWWRRSLLSRGHNAGAIFDQIKPAVGIISASDFGHVQPHIC
jgi:hypothetical protein